MIFAGARVAAGFHKAAYAAPHTSPQPALANTGDSQLPRNLRCHRKAAITCPAISPAWISRYHARRARLSGQIIGDDTTPHLLRGPGGRRAAVLTLSPGCARAGAVPDFDTSLAGNYLAARLASTERDQDAAVVYLRNLMKLDARNEDILERTFFAMLMDGQIDDAMKLADRR